jgi:hypothetical protein
LLRHALAIRLRIQIVAIMTGPQGEGVELDDEMIEHLRELGYME